MAAARPSHPDMTDREAGSPGRSPAASPCLGARPDGLCVRLVPRQDAPAAELPCVVLHEGRFSRVLLAEVATADGGSIASFAWKIRRDGGRPAAGGVAPTNAQVDAMWARERAELARVRSPHVVEAFAVPDGMLSSAGLYHCRRIDRCFHPVSPANGARLRVCRDDAWLAACGLPAYAEDVVRYSYDGGSVPPTLYRQGAEPDVQELLSGAQVRSDRQLVRDLAALVHAADGDPVAAAAAADWACLTCPHRAECYPRDAGSGPLPAERQLHAVSFHDVDAIAMPVHPFDYGEAIALLGGAPWPGRLAAGRGGRAAAVPAVVARALTEGPQGWFIGDPERHLLEVLRQKLRLFLDVCEGVAAVHATGRPHLALAPAHVLVSFGGAAGAPARWQLQARLTDLGSAAPVVMPDGAPLAVGPLLEPGPDMRDDAACRAYLAPALRGGEAATSTLPVACWQTGSPDGLVRFVVEVQGPAVPRTFRSGDLAIVQPESGGPTLVARIEEVRPRGLLATALLPPADPCVAWDGQQFAARVSFHRWLGPSADFPGLGLLLLHALLVDDQQGIEEVADAMARCLQRLEEEPTGVRVEERATALRLQQLLASKELRGRFDPSHLLHRAADREALGRTLARGQAAIPPAIHGRLLEIAARAMAWWQPFAYAATLADGSSEPLQRLRADVAAVVGRIDVELFHAPRRDAAVAAAAAEFAEELRARGGADGGAAPPSNARTKGFRLLVRRDGDDQGQELRYEIDRVTIGRREGENLLRLNDPMVSSLHAVIESTPDGFVVFDRNSTNGTEVDGIRLPVEVPQPLEDGSAIVIKPFRLTFHALTPTGVLARGEPKLVAGTLRERLHEAFAATMSRGSVGAHDALLTCLRSLAGELPPAALLACVEELAGPRRVAAAAPAGDGATPLLAASARALQQLSNALLGPAEFATAEQIQQFVGKIGRFVDATSQWMERLLELRKVLGKHLDLGFASTVSGRPSVRTAAEVRALVAGWAADAPPADPAAWYVAKFYDDVVAILVGLLEGNQHIRKAVRDRLDPARLVQSAGQEPRLRVVVQAAATSALWKHYEQAFLEVTGGAARDEELAQLLQRVKGQLGEPS